ncbi:MAG TPA: methyltransferase domain-containing protein [Methanocella sp.]|jgi:SAM-dependent methyltransferase
MTFHNVYEDEERAEAYARLEFPGTYYLAYRDLPAVIAEHVSGRKALDFGCGAGRSARFLKKLGFSVTGVDISPEMVRKARGFDPSGDYRVIGDGDFSLLEGRTFDLVQSVFTFDNVPTRAQKVRIFSGLCDRLNDGGKIVSLVSSPDVYKHEWASFTTKDFPSNKTAKTGDRVWTIMTDVEDRRPVEDVIWYDEDYRDVYREAGLEVVRVYKPLAREDEPFKWVNETRIAPWVIYVLQRTADFRA